MVPQKLTRGGYAVSTSGCLGRKERLGEGELQTEPQHLGSSATRQTRPKSHQSKPSLEEHGNPSRIRIPARRFVSYICTLHPFPLIIGFFFLLRWQEGG